MDVNCEQRNCRKMLEMRDEARYCHRCDGYYCDEHYERFHYEHDKDTTDEPKWATALQR